VAEVEIQAALARIEEARLAVLAAAEAMGAAAEEGGGGVPGVQDEPACVPKALPAEQILEAAALAAEVFPANSPMTSPYAGAAAAAMDLDPMRIAVMTTKWWGPRQRVLEVRFLDNPAASLRKRILSHLNAWDCGVTFRETRADGQIRISRGRGGYYSYLGTDNLLVRTGVTMNLEGFTDRTPESEFLRVVRHEGGHALGCPHEHMRPEHVARIAPAKAYDYFWRTQRWDREVVDQQVLTPLNVRSIFGTPYAEEDSCMCYQLPGSITKDGKPIKGGSDITASDRKFIQGIYPKAAPAQDDS
jgi:hypothetical protein